eukprot:scaffold211497_cov36-Cyclotella_meneghiniana.AAC.1
MASPLVLSKFTSERGDDRFDGILTMRTMDSLSDQVVHDYMTLAVDCCDETSPIHLLGFALKLDIDEVMAERSYSCETIL